MFGRAIFDCIKMEFLFFIFILFLFKKHIFRRQDGDKMIIISDMQQMKSPLLGSLLSAKKIDR